MFNNFFYKPLCALSFAALLCCASGPVAAAQTHTPLRINVKEGQKFEHDISASMEMILELPDEFLDNQAASLFPAGNSDFMFKLLLAKIKEKKPLINLNMAVNIEYEILPAPANELILASHRTKALKMSAHELVMGMGFDYDSLHPEKNYSTLPVPFDFKELDTLLGNASVTEKMTNRGAIIGYEGLNALLASMNPAQAKEAQSLYTQLSTMEIPSSLCNMIFPENGIRAGDEWQKMILQLPEPILKEIKAELSFLDPEALLSVHYKVLSRESGVTTIEVSFPSDKIENLDTGKGVTVSTEGFLLHGTLTFDDATGVAKAGSFVYDFKITAAFDQSLPELSGSPKTASLIFRGSYKF